MEELEAFVAQSQKLIKAKKEEKAKEEARVAKEKAEKARQE